MRKDNKNHIDLGFTLDDLNSDNFSIEKINAITQNDEIVDSNVENNIETFQIIDYNYNNKQQEDDNKDSKGKILKLYGYLSKGIEPKVFAYIDWGRIQTYDIRKLYSDADGVTQLGKGISFNSNEIKRIRKAICVNNLFIINYQNPIKYKTPSQELRIYKNILSFRYNDLSKQINIAQWIKSRYYQNGIGLDFRKWSSNGKLLKGIFIKNEELEKLKNLLEENIELPIELNISFNDLLSVNFNLNDNTNNDLEEYTDNNNEIEFEDYEDEDELFEEEIDGDIDNEDEYLEQEESKETNIKNDFHIQNNVLIKYTGNKKYLDIPNNVYKINKDVFEDDNLIESIKIPASVKVIHPYVFDNCENLKEINVENNNNFRDLCGVLFDSNFTKLIRVPIAYNNNVSIPETVKIIGNSAYSCCNFKEISLKNKNIKIIENYAFWNCLTLKKIILNDSIETIENNAFDECENLKNIYFLGDKEFELNLENVPKECYIGNLLEDFIIKNGKLINYFGNDKLVKIPEKVEIINEEAFNDGIKKIIIPKNVSEINEYAFDNCKSLEEIFVEKDNKYFSSLNGILYNKDKTKLIRVPISAKTFKLSANIKIIGASSFSECVEITNINLNVLPNVYCIEENAFWGCPNLEKVTLSKNIVKSGHNAFENCKQLEKINCYKNTEIDFPSFIEINYIKD